jgi:beta-N-acetylhexosaminidase
MTSSLDRLALAVQLPGFPGTSLGPAVARLFEEGLGGVCLFAGNSPETGAVAHAIRELAPNAVVAIDEEGGDVTRLHAATGSPMLGHAALGVVDDVALTRRTAAAIGAELAAAGVTLNLGPVADVNSNPDNPVIGVRSFGATPELVARHVTAYVEGLQSTGVAACAKHFPGHGATHEDSHLSLPRVEASLDQLRERELLPFAAALEAGVAAVMTSHVVVTAVDSEQPATLSARVLSLLRDDLRYDGPIVSDALDMAGASAGRGVPAAAVSALKAGCDLLCLGADKDVALVRAVQAAVVAAVRAGELSESRLVEAASRLGPLGRRTPGEAAQPDAGWQLAGARAALRVDGELPDLTHAVVARIDTAPSIAVGDVPWGLPADVVLVVGDSIAAARPVVLQVRDAYRHPAVLALIEGLGRHAVVVEYGWPGPWSSSSARVCTFGASVPGREAVAEYLREKGWTP